MIQVIIFLLVVFTKIIKRRFLCYTSTFSIKQIHIQSQQQKHQKGTGFFVPLEKNMFCQKYYCKNRLLDIYVKQIAAEEKTLRKQLFFCLLYKSRITMRTGCNERLLAFFTQVGNHFSKSFFNVYFLVIFSFVLSAHIVFI